MENEQRKALNFDLDTKALKQYYPNKNYRQAYKDVKRFLLNNGFEHRQWSGYTSIKPMTDGTIRAKMLKLKKALPWISKCVNRFDVTDIGEQHDLTHILTGKHKGKVKVVQKEELKPKENKPLFSAKKLNDRANQISKQPHMQNNKSRSKDMER